ncbi:hypothetical protein Ahy_A03g012761 [Arachis hypogaea]|uniref:K-box domain-containing protein n=1 Tax=Arachis hypogaea TaxID=3818 RepID=A0A445DU50_ARAHY|nr:hypothetical protein Ahy_A03g012761 [Arachis hypogaea]
MLVSAVKCGRIQVDGERVPVSYIVKSSQKISHFVHRHEPPVMACEVPILQKELDVLTVCKPASVPFLLLELPQELLQLGIGAICPDDPIPFVEDLADQIVEILNYFGHLLGEDLGPLSIKELQNLEKQLEGSLAQARQRKLVVDANIDYNAREGRSTVERQIESYWN